MTLEEVRKEVEEIDKQIIELIQKRTQLAEEIVKIKKKNNTPIEDTEQNQKVINRATDLATEKNLDTGNIKQIFQLLIQMNIQKQHSLKGEGGNLP
ncbi:MAG: Chorismate mutase [Candidatus Methanohalarchaeum thermophilum]|uniref:Chorismate mutase n=1 Tax=Methanohalarchaeum thermophilum TaxID=1903181 RepID=A0A1Q6DSQ0_METT1|nr:MAG: Chorismate mutase [Candidatus Methanohalarchaeum thermophilum]